MGVNSEELGNNSRNPHGELGAEGAHLARLDGRVASARRADPLADRPRERVAHDLSLEVNRVELMRKEGGARVRKVARRWGWRARAVGEGRAPPAGAELRRSSAPGERERKASLFLRISEENCAAGRVRAHGEYNIRQGSWVGYLERRGTVGGRQLARGRVPGRSPKAEGGGIRWCRPGIARSLSFSPRSDSSGESPSVHALTLSAVGRLGFRRR